MKNQKLNIVIGGEAGQGLVTLGTLLSKAFVRHDYKICVTQGYQSRIRGGHNTFAIRISSQEIAAPDETIDLLIALNEETVGLHKSELASDGLVICDSAFTGESEGVLKVPYGELASKRFENISALGIMGAIVGLEKELLTSLIEDTFAKKGEEILGQNKEALAKSYDWGLSQNIVHKKLPSINSDKNQLMMNGNEAIALGALSAGVKFCSFYPMTPSTSISLALAKFSKEIGMVVEQAEGEIAAINMALGASFAGAPSMVATSGGGFALMVEGISLAAMTETPIVVVVAQRPGPATGLPTRTEQADLEFVLYSGHGEFPRAIFAPGTVEDCFYLTRKAFELAEKSQGPVFILTDQFLADSYRAVKRFPLEDLNPVKVGGNSEEAQANYRRFELTDSGVSQRLIPGMSRHLVIVDSDEHTEDGHLTEDLDVRDKMVEKRLKKGKIFLDDFIEPEYFGDNNPETLFVSWGSTRGSGAEGLEVLKSRGQSVAMLHFSQVWPLVPETFIKKLENAKRVVSVEGNATSQFTKLLRRETGFNIEKRIVRYDGLPITPKYILSKLG